MAVRIFFLLVFTGSGCMVGGVYGLVRNLNPTPAEIAAVAESGPAPHHVPPQPGGIAFRFAMIHDILHERYPKHGEAYHRERERRLRESLATIPPDVPAFDDATDDLAIALGRLNRRDEAIQVLRAKLARQSAAIKSESDRYTTFSNLGAILLEESEAKAAAGDPEAVKRFAEGAAFARKAFAANPKAHYGRAEWQVKLAEFVRDGFAKPETFKERDFIGNDLGFAVSAMYDSDQKWTRGFGVKWRVIGSVSRGDLPKDDDACDDPTKWGDLERYRYTITNVGQVNEHGFGGVSFDIPMLAAVGIWRQSLEPSPHLALGIGETMVRVGQRNLAWCAFERAAKLDSLRVHCRGRQSEIESSLGINGAERRREHEAERAFGESWQKAYQEHEAKQIAKGVSLGAPDFYTGLEPIASPSGDEERATWYPPGAGSTARMWSMWRWALIVGAIGAWLFAGIIRLRRAVKKPTDREGSKVTIGGDRKDDT